MPHLGAFVPSSYFAFIYVPAYSAGKQKPGQIAKATRAESE